MTQCKFCKRTDSPNWWKCCPEHTPEKDSEVVCMWCAVELHAPDAEKQVDISPISKNVFGNNPTGDFPEN